MTKQDKKIDKWRINIGGGFGKFGSKVYPHDRLTAFLNFKSKSKYEAGKFCTKYQIIPPGLDWKKDNILEAIKIEQDLLRSIANKIASRVRLNDDDISIINERVSNIRKSLTQVSSQKLNKLNQSLTPQTILPEDEYIITTSTHENSIASLWEDLANKVITRDLAVCINCGGFYHSISRHKRKFCKPECASAYRQRKFRNK